MQIGSINCFGLTKLCYDACMEEFRKVAIEAAREAGALALSFSRDEIKFQEKGPYDILAEADTKSESLIIGKIKNAFPNPGSYIVNVKGKLIDRDNRIIRKDSLDFTIIKD